MPPEPPLPLTPEPGQDPPDRDLVARTLAGHPSAFDVLVERYQQRVYGVIFNMTNNHADTNDLLMETFTKAYRALDRYKEGSAFYTWLYSIAYNHTINFLKRNKGRFHVSMDDEEVGLESRSEMIQAAPTDAIEGGERLEALKEKLNEALMNLSEEHRAVVTLFDVQGLSHLEIGKIVGCSEGTVRSRLFYARKQLQKSLKKFL